MSLIPPNAEDVRSVVEDRLAALSQVEGLKETVTVEWRGAREYLPVISMPLDLLTYNPDTHRIKAQRSLDPARNDELIREPFGSYGQSYLYDLLIGDPTDPAKTDPNFEALRDDIKKHGQTEPGVITRAGVLVNGNTRRAALSQLGRPDMRVGVLPPDAGLEDIQTVELSLQLRERFERDYSFMNSLLAIDERVNAGWPPDRIQREFRIRAKTYERSRWILEAVRDIMERSRAAESADEQFSLRLVDFETHQGKLEELYRAYSALKSKSPGEAEALREQRLLAIALNKSKTDVRLIEPDFTSRYMKSVLPTLPTPDPDPVKIPGTSITAPLPSADVVALRDLTTKVVRAKAITLAPSSATPEELDEANGFLGTIGEALEGALTSAGKQTRVVKKRFAPVDRLSDANDDLELSLAAVAEARATGTFDPDDLDEALVALRNSLRKLAQLVVRDATSPAEGIAWLQSVGSLSEES